MELHHTCCEALLHAPSPGACDLQLQASRPPSATITLSAHAPRKPLVTCAASAVSPAASQVLPGCTRTACGQHVDSMWTAAPTLTLTQAQLSCCWTQVLPGRGARSYCSRVRVESLRLGKACQHWQPVCPLLQSLSWTGSSWLSCPRSPQGWHRTLTSSVPLPTSPTCSRQAPAASPCSTSHWAVAPDCCFLRVHPTLWETIQPGD